MLLVLRLSALSNNTAEVGKRIERLAMGKVETKSSYKDKCSKTKDQTKRRSKENGIACGFYFIRLLNCMKATNRLCTTTTFYVSSDM